MKAYSRLWAVAALLALVVVCNAAHDHWFPRFHPRPKTHWINDPNGPMYYNGMYHLFTQYNPYGPNWGSMSWSHMVSYDLAFWFEMPVALLPDMPYDSYGVYSGSTTITEDGNVFIAYTCVDGNTTQRQCIAYPKDPTDKFLQEWVKYEGNPIISDPPPTGDGQSFRDDTTAWTLDGKYIMAVGSSLNGTGAVWLYTSSDFKSWTSLNHSLFESNAIGSMFECPDFFPVTDMTNPTADSVYLLKVSWNSLDYYLLGSYDSVANKFTPTTPFYIYDHGKMYASKSFWDPVGNRQILWGWVSEDFDTTPGGWQGVMSLPRSITYNSQFNMVTQTPIDNLKALRVADSAYSDSSSLKTYSNWDCSSESWTSNQFEAEFTLDFSECSNLACSAGVYFLTSADATQTTTATITWGQPLGPFVNQSLNIPGMQQIGNITLPKHSTRPVLIAKCQELCQATPECVSWTFIANYSWDSSSLHSIGNLTAPPGPHSLPKTHGKADASPANPHCFLYSGDELAPNSIFQGSQYCTDCASGLDYSDSPYPMLVVNRTNAGQGQNGANVGPLFGVIPVDTASPALVFNLHLYVDHSISEVYVNDTAIMVIRTYPDESSNHWGVFTNDNQIATISASVKAWQLLDATVS